MREFFYLLGFKPGPRTFGHHVRSFDLGSLGTVKYAQWEHPSESLKSVSADEIHALRDFLQPGDTTIDIGAHTGDTAIPMAVAVGPEGTVLALEPNPYVFPVLEANAHLNDHIGTIVPLPFAATREDGTYDFQYGDEGYCNGGIHEGISRWRHGSAFNVSVSGRNLCDWIRSQYPHLWARIRYVKIDAEGYDYEVLKSLTPLVDDVRPHLKIEVNKHLSRKDRAEMIDFLAGRKYAIHEVRSDSDLRGDAVDSHNVALRRHFDIFCIPLP